MSSPGTGSTNQAQTITAFKRLLGKANTSAIKEVYEETIPSNIQLDTSTIFGQVIPQAVTTNTLLNQSPVQPTMPTQAHLEVSDSVLEMNHKTLGLTLFN